MFPVQNGLICWLDAMDGKAGDTLLKDRTSYGHNLIVENFQQGYGFTGTSIKVKQSKIGTSNNNALYIANGGFKTSCKSFCICIERHNTNQPWYIFDGRGLNGQGLSTNHCFNGNTGSSYDNSKTRRDGVLTYDNSNLDTNKKTFLYFELKEAELFTLSILMRCSKNENTEGEFYSLYAYNRALTEEEILQNMEYENNKISYVNENNLPKIVDKLSNASNIKITGNKYGNRVQTVIDKIVEKADNVTKAIEQEVNNNSYSFKVGQGNNVDVISDVQDSFSNLAIKGVTYQNLFNNFSMSQEATNYITVNENTIKWTKSAVTTFNVNIKYHNSLAQLGKTYTLVFYIYKNTLQKEGAGDSYNVAKFNIVSYNSGVCFIPVNKTGLVKVKLIQPTTTPSDGKPYLEVYKDSVGEFEISYPILLEGDCTSDDNIPSSCFEGIVGVGDKSKNLFNPKSVKFGITLNTNTGEEMNSHLYVTSDFIPVLEKTDYTVKGLPVIHYYNESKEQIAVKNTPVEGVIRTPQNCKWIRMRNYDQILITEQKLLIKKSSFILGTYDTFEPYYDNYAIDVLSCGRNLWNPKINLSMGYGMQSTCKYENNILTVSGIGDGSAECYSNARFITVETKEDTGYYFHCKTDGIYGGSNATDTVECFTFGMDTQKFITFNGNPNGFTFNSGKNKSIGFRFDCNKNDLSHIFYDFNLTETKTKIDYEPYKEDKIQILLDEPLMRLPNGVCDEITRDGKLIRRVGKIVFDGTENWSPYNINGNTTHFAISVPYTDKFNDGLISHIENNNNKFMCDKALVTKTRDANLTSICSFYYGLENRYFMFNLPCSSLESAKNWLVENKPILYFPLPTPIITNLSESQIRIFKDGHLTFNTLVAPESTHVVQLNKSAQIERSIREVQSLDNRINVLENNYDNLMLSTISRLNDLELNYKLK